MSDTALLAVLVAAVGGVLAGLAWAAGRGRDEKRRRPGFRSSPHYSEGLHALATGQLELAIHELDKVRREHPDSVEVLQVLSHLYREVGKTERAIEIHRALIKRRDLTRAERAYALASLGTDYRKAGFLDRAAEAYGEALLVDPRNLHALAGQQKLHEDQRQWREAFETQTRIARMRKSDDALVLGFLQTEMGRDALAAGRRDAAEEAFRTALSLDRRVFPAHLALADLWLEQDPRRAAQVLEDAIAAVPGAGLPRVLDAAARLRGVRRAVALHVALRAPGGTGPARLAGTPEPGAPAAQRRAPGRGARPAAAGTRGEPARAAGAPRGVAHAARAVAARAGRAEIRGDRRGVGTLRGPAHLHRLPLPRRRHALALPALPRVEHAGRGARGSGGGYAVRSLTGVRLLVALLLATFVVRPLVHGVPLASVLVFWSIALGQAIVPGVLLVHGAGLVNSRDRGAVLGQGASLGLALQGLSLLAGRALGISWLPTAAALAAAGLGLWLLRRAPERAQQATLGTSPLTIGVALLAALLQPLSSARDPGEVPLDLLFHAGNAAELRHRWPLEDPRAAGIPLAYHLLAYSLPVEAADRAAGPVADPLLALAPPLWVALLTLQVAQAGRLLFASAAAGSIGAALVVLHSDPGRYVGLAPGAFNSHLATGVYGSPTTVVGLVLLAALVIALDAWLAAGGVAAIASFGLLALAASAAKTTVLPVVWAGLGVVALRALVRGRPPELRRAAVALAVAGALGAPLTLWQTGGREGYNAIVQLAPASVFTSSGFAAALARASGAAQLSPWLAAPGFLLWLVGYLGLPGLAAALWLAKRREPLGTLQVFSLGAIAAGFALGLALDVPGLSQLFLIYDAQLLLALFGGAGLLLLWPPRRPLRGGAIAALALLALLTVPYLGQLARGLRGALSEDWSAALRTPSPTERDYAAGLSWLRDHASRDAVVFADNPSLLLSAFGEVRLFYENGVYTVRAWHVAPGAEPWPERAALQERLLRRPDAAALAEARRAVGAGPRLMLVADAVQSRIDRGIVRAAPGPVPARRLFPEPLFERPYLSGTLQVYEARGPVSGEPR